MARDNTDSNGRNEVGGRLVRAIAAGQTIRLIAVDSTPLVETLRSIHDAGPLGAKAMGRLATAAALLSATLKDRQQVSVQVNGDGPLREVYAVADSAGNIRATSVEPRAHLESGTDSLEDGFGAGRMTVTRKLSEEAPYRGVVNLITGEIAEDLAHYLLTSDQIPSAVSIGEILTIEGVAFAGGLLVQAMPGVEDAVLGRLIQKLESLPPVAEIFRDGGDPASLLLGMADDVEILDDREIRHVCPCSREQFARNLCMLGEADLKKLTEELDETIAECHFCRTEYTFNTEEVSALLYGARMYDEAD